MTFYTEPSANLYQNTFEGSTTLPDWLTLTKTILLQKNEHTHAAKNYRPIVCLNLTYKLYTSCLNNFLEHHCRTNSIITTEQAGGKKGKWGTTEKLLINKNILKEAQTLKRNIYNVWLDYQKAFDSVTHEWLLRSLQSAKVPLQLLSAIENLTKYWSTIASLHGTNKSVINDVIKYRNGISQSATLSVLLFVLCLKLLSFLLQNLKGYSYGKSRNHTLTHNFFVDELEFYASPISILKKQLDLVTTFSNDIVMKFGQDKCAYIKIEKGKNTTTTPIETNGLTIKPIQEGESFRYLGQDENIAYEGTINKGFQKSSFLE